ncbi:MAG: alkaline phosphatase family protein [Acidobacteriota bacterium]
MQNTLTLAIFIDALGWELSRRYGFLSELLVHQSPLQTVFGYSSTCDPTILTGVAPREHGHFAFFAYAPGRGSFPASWRHLRALPKAVTSRGRVRHWMSKIGIKHLGWTGYFSLYNVPFERLTDLEYTERRDLYRPGGIRGGQPTVFDALDAGSVLTHVSDWRADEASNLRALESSLVKERPGFAYLYLAALDGLLHRVGTESAEVEQKLRGYEESIRRVVGVAEALYGDVRLLLFSDHGMKDVDAHSQLKPRIEALPLAWGQDYGSIFDATMARFTFQNARAERLIRAELEREPLGAVVSDGELRRWGCDFRDDTYGQLFFLLRPGALFVPSDLGEKPLRAMHGYRPEAPESVAFFGSNRPVPLPPRGLADLADVMLDGTGAPSLPSLRRAAVSIREAA